MAYKSKKRIGIYSGTFDPVHIGHIAFALQAINQANLDLVVFMPERRPRHKSNVEHFGHRTAMITRAIKPYRKLALFELPDVHFSVTKTLPKLYLKFTDSELVMLMGSDVVDTLENWPDLEQLFLQSELVIGLREGSSRNKIQAQLNSFDIKPKVTFINSIEPSASSEKVRQALRGDPNTKGLLASVKRYAHTHWLYVSLEKKT